MPHGAARSPGGCWAHALAAHATLRGTCGALQPPRGSMRWHVCTCVCTCVFMRVNAQAHQCVQKHTCTCVPLPCCCGATRTPQALRVPGADAAGWVPDTGVGSSSSSPSSVSVPTPTRAVGRWRLGGMTGPAPLGQCAGGGWGDGPSSARYQGPTQLPPRTEGRFQSQLQDAGCATQRWATAPPLPGGPSGKRSQPSPVPTDRKRAPRLRTATGRPCSPRRLLTGSAGPL